MLTNRYFLFTNDNAKHISLLFIKLTYIIYLFVSIQGTAFLLSLQLRIVWKKLKFIIQSKLAEYFFIVIKEIGNCQIWSVII